MTDKTSLNVIVLSNDELSTLNNAIKAIIMMADRVEGSHEVNIINQLRDLLKKLEKQSNNNGV